MTIARWPLQYSDAMYWYLPLETGKDIAMSQNMVSTGNQISVDVSNYPAIDINVPNLSGVTTNIQTQLNGKEPTITAGVSGQYWRGDKSWQTLNTAAVPELTNLYYTDTRARASLSSTVSALTYTASTGVFSLTSGYMVPTTTDAANWNSAYSAIGKVNITDDTTTAATMYPVWVTANTGLIPTYVSSTKLSFVPSTGTLTLPAASITSTTDSSSTTTGSITTAGGAGIAKKLYVGTGIYLPTSGGTQGELNYYEVYVYQTTIAGCGLTFSDVVFYIVRIGNLVTMRMVSDSQYGTATSAGYFSNDSLTYVPARFLPNTYFRAAWPIIENNIAYSNGFFTLNTSGSFTFHSVGIQNFPNGVVDGIIPSTVSWVL